MWKQWKEFKTNKSLFDDEKSQLMIQIKNLEIENKNLRESHIQTHMLRAKENEHKDLHKYIEKPKNQQEYIYHNCQMSDVNIIETSLDSTKCKDKCNENPDCVGFGPNPVSGCNLYSDVKIVIKPSGTSCYLKKYK